MSVDKQRQPNSGMVGIGPCDTVAAMGRQEYRVAWTQGTILLFASD